MVIATFMLLMFGTLFIALQNRIIVMNQVRNFDAMTQVGNVVATEVRLAAQVGDGYKRDFTIPLTLHGRPYNISIEDRWDLVLKFEDMQYIEFLELPVDGEIKKGLNIVTCCNESGGDSRVVLK